MARLRLLADDLTGALDSAARFVPLTGPVAVTWRDDAALEREGRCQHTMIEPAQARGEFQRHMAAQQTVDFLEGRLAAVQ